MNINFQITAIEKVFFNYSISYTASNEAAAIKLYSQITFGLKKLVRAIFLAQVKGLEIDYSKASLQLFELPYSCISSLEKALKDQLKESLNFLSLLKVEVISGGPYSRFISNESPYIFSSFDGITRDLKGQIYFNENGASFLGAMEYIKKK